MSAAQTCDAVFDICATQSEVTLQEMEISGTMVVSACNYVYLGPNLRITSTGQLDVHAGNAVYMYPGFEVDQDGKIGMTTGQPMPPPP